MNTELHTPALTVTELNRYIKSVLGADDVLSALTIRGEISNFKAHSSGHLYFTLKDEGAEISAVMFRADASRMNFRPTDGMRVLAFGNADFYEKSGRIQVYVRTMRADGVGAMAIAYERLKRQLEAEGLFAPERKKPLPAYPSCVGVITAPTGAAIRDILNITGRRYPQAKILLYPSLVQGADAPASLCGGLAYFNADRSCDVIILGRGGGSAEDLWAFNDEALVRAVAASDIPVISAVGHETDVTLCDFAADKRAPTPSAAAELAVPDRGELLRRTAAVGEAMTERLWRLIQNRRNEVLTKSKTLSLLSPEGKLGRMRQAVDHDSQTLDRLVRRILERDGARLRSSAERLEVLSPLAVLSRGYGAVQTAEGRIVGSVKELCVGEKVHLILKDGCAEAQIQSIENKEAEDRSNGGA
ncbi:MAG: exodeoxyribonuclease VII large subunit [Clostridia bacterium]|nr:exodeoxyribonuclease VII large subunit [Clostridia bacterium]